MEHKLLHKINKPEILWQEIKLVIFDCDGVITDGKIIYCGEELEAKHFSAHDGIGFMLLNRAELTCAVITGRSSVALERRCKDLRITHLCQGVMNKLEQTKKLLKELKLNWDNVAYMGDDWNDIPVMQTAAFSVCPADAMPEIKHLADFTTQRIAGDGAARECIDYILHKKGLYEKAVARYLQEITQA
jgi:3-deoxy-D-manno-octulosonate 8-phosphate phosphatase (KDO 8-P phosphatase)